MDANTVAAWAAVTSAIAAGIAVVFTRKQNRNTELQLQNMQLQNRNIELQTLKMQTQINLSLYKKRYDIYTALMVLINTVIDVNLPGEGENRQRFNDEILSCLKTFWKDSREKEFLLDDELNQYIDSVEKKIKAYHTSINQGFITSDPFEYHEWRVKASNKQIELISLCSEPIHKFKKYLDFKKIDS